LYTPAQGRTGHITSYLMTFFFFFWSAFSFWQHIFRGPGAKANMRLPQLTNITESDIRKRRHSRNNKIFKRYQNGRLTLKVSDFHIFKVIGYVCFMKTLMFCDCLLSIGSSLYNFSPL
jgi:hypothetical protein